MKNVKWIVKKLNTKNNDVKFLMDALTIGNVWSYSKKDAKELELSIAENILLDAQNTSENWERFSLELINI